jgi:hypothetical protein
VVEEVTAAAEVKYFLNGAPAFCPVCLRPRSVQRDSGICAPREPFQGVCVEVRVWAHRCRLAEACRLATLTRSQVPNWSGERQTFGSIGIFG